MNCKPGDMARLVHGYLNPGLLLEVVEASPPHDQADGPAWFCKPVWPAICEFNGHPVRTAEVSIWPDAWLRPIKPGDLDDSKDTRAGKPNETVRDIIHEVAA